MTDPWKPSEQDGDRTIRRRAQEFLGNAEHVADRLRQLQQVSDAHDTRRQAVRAAAETAQRLTEQLREAAR